MPDPVVNLRPRHREVLPHLDALTTDHDQATGSSTCSRATEESEAPRREDIWALRDVSFDVRRGEVLGVIGPNGAGKSTLLSILARITEPTTGRIEIRGRVSSLLEVGTGFHPELSGRDNVFLNGAILGHEPARGQREVRRDRRVLRSRRVHGHAGQAVLVRHVRPARVSSIAAHLDPEVLLLDEVLAVGDSAFQQKCLHRIDSLTQSGRTVLFVSHAPAAVAQLCQRVIVVNGGGIVFDGDVDEGINEYLGSPQIDGGASALQQETQFREGTGELRVTAVRVLGAEEQIVPNQPVTFEVDIAAEHETSGRDVVLNVGIWNIAAAQPIVLSTAFAPPERLPDFTPDATRMLICQVDELPLRPARYVVSVSIVRDGVVLDSCRHQAEFTLHPGDFYGSGVIPGEAHTSPVLLRQHWHSLEAGPAPADGGTLTVPASRS